jgi:hypothetical protein
MKMAYELEKTLDEVKSASYLDEFTLGISEFRRLLQSWIAEKVKRSEQIFDESDMLKLKNQICRVRHYRWKEIGRSINKRSRDCKSNWARYVQKRTMDGTGRRPDSNRRRDGVLADSREIKRCD